MLVIITVLVLSAPNFLDAFPSSVDQESTTLSPVGTGDFESSDAYSVVETTNAFLKRQIRSAEKLLTSLQIQARDAFDLNSVMVGRMVVDSDSVIRTYLSSLQEVVSQQMVSNCLPDERISDLAASVKPIVMECTRASSKRATFMFERVQFDLEEMNEQLEWISSESKACFQEPGFGEKINCMLEMVSESDFESLITAITETVARVSRDFTENLKTSSRCINKASNGVVGNINETIKKAHECVRSSQT